MSYDHPDDEDPDHEDWYDDDEADEDEDEAVRCPECGGPVGAVTDKCPACGYWLSAADRRSLRAGMRKPLWLRVTAWVILAAFLFSLLAVGAAIF